mgnify:CR=1 FL=1
MGFLAVVVLLAVATAFCAVKVLFDIDGVFCAGLTSLTATGAWLVGGVLLITMLSALELLSTALGVVFETILLPLERSSLASWLLKAPVLVLRMDLFLAFTFGFLANPS